MADCQIVWFDPGGVTGWCTAVIKSAWLAGGGSVSWEGLRQGIAVVNIGQIGRAGHSGDGRRAWDMEEKENIRQLDEILEEWPQAAWGYEDFIPESENMKRDFLLPVRVISGLVNLDYARSGNERVPFAQLASSAKTTCTDERMKKCGLYRVGLGHGTDAARHIALFMRRCRKDEKLRMEAWPEVFA